MFFAAPLIPLLGTVAFEIVANTLLPKRLNQGEDEEIAARRRQKILDNTFTDETINNLAEYLGYENNKNNKVEFDPLKGMHTSDKKKPIQNKKRGGKVSTVMKRNTRKKGATKKSTKQNITKVLKRKKK